MRPNYIMPFPAGSGYIYRVSYSLGRLSLFSNHRHQGEKAQFSPNELNANLLLFSYLLLRRYKSIIKMILLSSLGECVGRVKSQII